MTDMVVSTAELKRRTILRTDWVPMRAVGRRAPTRRTTTPSSLTVLGQDVTGGIIWGPSVLKEAESCGLYLTADNRLIRTVTGDVLPEDVKLIKPMKQIDIDALTPFTPEQMRARASLRRATGSGSRSPSSAPPFPAEVQNWRSSSAMA